jgi:hypothetical protein
MDFQEVARERSLPLSVVPDGRCTRCAAFAAAMGRTSRALSRTASNLRRSFSSKNSEGRKSKSDAGEGGDAEATEPSSQNPSFTSRGEAPALTDEESAVAASLASSAVTDAIEASAAAAHPPVATSSDAEAELTGSLAPAPAAPTAAGAAPRAVEKMPSSHVHNSLMTTQPAYVCNYEPTSTDSTAATPPEAERTSSAYLYPIRKAPPAVHPLLRWLARVTCTEGCFTELEAAVPKAVPAKSLTHH